MRLALLAVMLVHGLIHLMGFAKAFGYAEMRGLTQRISRPIGLLWLVCALAFTTAATLFIMGRESWWWIGAPAVILSQVVIFTSWHDAKFGTLANLIILVPLAAAGLEARPGSYTNQYEAAVREGVARHREMPLVTEADIMALPAPVQRYLRFAGAVGKPRVQNFRAVFVGEFRNGRKSRWMRFRSEQYDFLDQPTRVFLMKASMFGLPVEGLHLFREDGATMRIKMASLFQVVDARGPKMNQGETVTLFNDLCVMAPACLVDREAIQWEEVGPLTVRAKYTRRGITIGAELSFDESGRLTNFVSNDRFLSADGKTYASYPWSTPVHEYRDLDGRRVASDADVVWDMPEGDFSYGKFHLVTIEYNVTDPR
jgi:hypothetical protein